MTARPPRLALWLHERTLTPLDREAVLGDLVEEFGRLAEQRPGAARWWIWRQTMASAVPNLRRRFRARPAGPGEGLHNGERFMNGLLTDVRFAIRILRRQPLTTLVALLSLGAALTVNLVLAALANAVLFRPFDLRDPGRLSVVLLQRPSGLNHNLSYPDYAAARDAARSLDALVAYSRAEATLSTTEGAQAIGGELVSGNYFDGLGVPMQQGRGLGEVDDRPSAAPAVVVSERVWRDRLAGAPIAGQTLQLNGVTFTVVGVASRSYSGMQLGRSASFWIPLAHRRTLMGGEDVLTRASTSWLTVVARVGAGLVPAVAREELDAILRRQFEARGRPVEPVILRPGARGDSMLPEALGSPIRLLLAAGGLVLLLACLNVANLQLARNDARRMELAVRSALGARRGQLVRLMLIDAFLLSVPAGALAFAVAALTKERAASLIAFFGQPVALSVPLDGRVIAAALLLSVSAAAIVALLSTWQVLRGAQAGHLAEGRPSSRVRRPVQRGLVIAQFALSLGLVTGAGLLVRTLDELRRTDLGFDGTRVALVEVTPEMGRLRGPAAVAYFERALRAVEAVPGVEAAAVGHVMPLDFGGSRTSVDVEGYRPAQDESMELNFIRVTPGYFETLGIPLRAGRTFDHRDVPGQPQRIIVNETMARRYWPDGRAVGRFVRSEPQGPYDTEVIGVVADVHYRMVREEPRPSFYVPLAQWPATFGVLNVRTAGEPAYRIDELRRVVAGVDSLVPVQRAWTLREQVERNIADERMARTIGVTIAAVALLLAAAGLYASMAFFVGRQTREIGVRVALGARGGDVLGLVLREGLTLAALGIAAGVLLAAWTGRMLRGQLYGVEWFDPLTLSAAAAILVTAALLASWLPARRASRVDPVVALREG